MTRFQTHLKQLLHRWGVKTGVGTLVLATALATATPAFAHDTTSPSATPKTLPTCTATLPVNMPCKPTITGTSATAYTVAVPGVGGLNLTLDPATGLITSATLADVSANFTASAVKISPNGKFAAVVFTSTTNPKKKIVLITKATPGGATPVKAIAVSPHRRGGCSGGRGDPRGYSSRGGNSYGYGYGRGHGGRDGNR